MSSLLTRALLAGGLAFFSAGSLAVASTGLSDAPTSLRSADDSRAQLASLGQARAGGKLPDRARSGKGMMKAVKELDLTANQRSQLMALKGERTGRPGLAKASRPANPTAAQRAALRAGGPDRSARAQGRQNITPRVMAILTPVQQETLKSSLKADRPVRARP